MAFDGLYLSKVRDELINTLEGSRIDKISQPEKDEIFISFRNKKGQHKLLMTSSSDTARVHLTENVKQNPMQAPLFTMVLRKNISGGRLKDIVQVNGDRILNFIIEATDEMGFDSLYTLTIEIMGKHSNIILIRQRDNRIIDCIKHVGLDVNSYRLLMPGALYKEPPKQDKIDPQSIGDSLPPDIDFDFNDPSVFMRHISGISRKTSQVMFIRFNELKGENTNEEAFIKVIKEALETDSFYIYTKDDEPCEISLLDLSPNDNSADDVEEFQSPSRCLEYFIGAKDQNQRVKERSQDIMKLVQINIDRIEKKLSILEKVIAEAGDKEKYMEVGELIKANIHSIKEGDEEIDVFDFFNNEGGKRKIKLNPHISAADNMQNYFKKYQKLKRSEENALEQISLSKEELNYLNTVADSILRSEEPSDINEIKQELIIAGYIKYRSKGKKKKENPSKPMRFKSSEGVTIYVGKNNNQNDYLTTKLAMKEDTWLHTKDFPGSHVIIKGENFSEETLLEAANLAAWYSKAQTGSKVPVDYTKVRNVKKPSGSKPGMVIYTSNKTLYINPEFPRIERI